MPLGVVAVYEGNAYGSETKAKWQLAVAPSRGLPSWWSEVLPLQLLLHQTTIQSLTLPRLPKHSTNLTKKEPRSSCRCRCHCCCRGGQSNLTPAQRRTRLGSNWRLVASSWPAEVVEPASCFELSELRHGCGLRRQAPRRRSSRFRSLLARHYSCLKMLACRLSSFHLQAWRGGRCGLGLRR